MKFKVISVLAFTFLLLGTVLPHFASASTSTQNQS